jgi:hypothetical protein
MISNFLDKAKYESSPLKVYDIEKEKKDISIIVANSFYEDIFLPLFATLFLGLWSRLGPRQGVLY